jgi:hypothetical protein
MPMKKHKPEQIVALLRQIEVERHPEKAGTKSVAIKLYGKRKQHVLEGKKLPELFRKPSVNFSQLIEDARVFKKE